MQRTASAAVARNGPPERSDSTEDTRPSRRRTSVHGLAARRGVVRHGRALVPRAAAEAVRRRSRSRCRRLPRRARAALSVPIATGLEASRRRRLAAQAARRRRLATRTVPAVALVLGSATMLPIAALRHGGGGQGAGAARGGSAEPDVPARACAGSRLPEAPFLRRPRRRRSPRRAGSPERRRSRRSSGTAPPRSACRTPAASSTAPSSRSRGPTGSPGTRSPTASRTCRHRLYGNERTIRTIISVLGAYRAAHPEAPRVVVGDISLRDGGAMDEHVSHQNGLDVDVYYPRLDRYLSAPIATEPDRPPPRPGSPRPLRRRGRADRLRRLLDRAPRAERRRHPVPEPREPHARPLPAGRLTRGRSAPARVSRGRILPALRPAPGRPMRSRS